MSRAAPPSSPFDLGAKVEFLSQPASYPERTSAVLPIETHMAWVFLTDRHAYKLKKPVKFEYLDFSTIAARRRMCRAEVRLNRRLAPAVYLGVATLGIDPAGRLGLETGSRIVDWLVKMRRLPAELMLDRMLREGSVPSDRLVSVGRLLGDFYRGAPGIRTSGRAYLTRIERDIEEIERELVRFGVDDPLVGRVSNGLRRFLRDQSRLLGDRATGGKIVEGHGDLRPEHVCLTPTPAVIDCIEFNRAFRTLDPADDLAYLAVECRRLGPAEVGRILLDTYAEVTGDRPNPELIGFYQAFRAALRAKIAIWHLRDEPVARPEQWLEKGREYLRLASEVLPGGVADVSPVETNRSGQNCQAAFIAVSSSAHSPLATFSIRRPAPGGAGSCPASPEEPMSAGTLCTRVVATATPEESVAVAARRMVRNEVGTLVVVAGGGSNHVVGIVTDRDITSRCVAADRHPTETTIGEVMTTPVHAVGEDTSVEDAVLRMADAGIRRLVVAGPDRALVGLLSLDDVLELIIEQGSSIQHLLHKQRPRVPA